MANLTRAAKSSTHWSENDLLAFNIRVKDTGVADFFNVPELPPPTISATILTNIDRPYGPMMKDDRIFFQYKKLVDHPDSRGSLVCDFIGFILGIMNYEDGDRLIRHRNKISFPMAGQLVDAYTDVFLTREENPPHELLLLVKEDKSDPSSSAGVPEPQVIASAIAAFYENNLQRTKSGLQPLQSEYIPALIMTGTAPTFYRIPVTTKLLDAVATATYPQEETTVLRFIPPVPDQARYRTDGMHPLDNRHIIFQCFEAFKAVIH